MRIRYAFCLLVFVAMVTCADVSQAITIRYEYTAGQTDRYTLVVTQENMKSQLDLSRVVETVQPGAGPGGFDLYTIKTVFNSGLIWVNGRQQDYTGATGDLQRSVIDQQGNLQQVTFLGDAADFATNVKPSLAAQVDFMQRLGVPDFPTGDIAVGSSWTRTAHFGEENVTYTYTLDADNDTTGVAGRTCAR